MRSDRSTRLETAPARLKGSGTVPRALALAALAVVTVFLLVWLSADSRNWPIALVIELLVLAAAIRAFFVGVFLAGDGVLIRGWFRNFRYGPGDLTRIDVVPYWRFLDAKDPILSLLKLRPASGWVREISATVAWKDRTLAHAAELRRHLGLDEA